MSVHEEGKALVKAILDRKGVKLCTHCGLTKPFSEFQEAYTNKKGEKRFRSECKACKNAVRNEWRKSNPTGPGQMRDKDAAKKYQAAQQQETLKTAEKYAVVWSEEDDQLLKDNLHLPNKDLAVLLGRTYTSVARRKTVLRKAGLLG